MSVQKNKKKLPAIFWIVISLSAAIVAVLVVGIVLESGVLQVEKSTNVSICSLKKSENFSNQTFIGFDKSRSDGAFITWDSDKKTINRSLLSPEHSIIQSQEMQSFSWPPHLNGKKIELEFFSYPIGVFHSPELSQFIPFEIKDEKLIVHNHLGLCGNPLKNPQFQVVFDGVKHMLFALENNQALVSYSLMNLGNYGEKYIPSSPSQMFSLLDQGLSNFDCRQDQVANQFSANLVAGPAWIAWTQKAKFNSSVGSKLMVVNVENNQFLPLDLKQVDLSALKTSGLKIDSKTSLFSIESSWYGGKSKLNHVSLSDKISQHIELPFPAEFVQNFIFSTVNKEPFFLIKKGIGFFTQNKLMLIRQNSDLTIEDIVGDFGYQWGAGSNNKYFSYQHTPKQFSLFTETKHFLIECEDE